MRAAVVTGPGQVRIDRVPQPKPGPSQVRIRLQGCGVCASNLTPWEGPEWITHRYPLERLGDVLNATRYRPGTVEWVRKLTEGERFSGTTTGLLDTARTLDRLYGR